MKISCRLTVINISEIKSGGKNENIIFGIWTRRYRQIFDESQEAADLWELSISDRYGISCHTNWSIKIESLYGTIFLLYMISLRNLARLIVLANGKIFKLVF